MKPEEIREKVEGIPHMSYKQATEMVNIIYQNQFHSILELGFDHGVSTCYMAGALDELDNGHITTIDLKRAEKINPNIEQLLENLGLNDYVTIFYEPTSYIWRLMKMLEQDPKPRFDLCYIDGAHNWFTDGFAFFLVDKLLIPGGLIVFDDLNWTYKTSPTLKNSEKVKSMPFEEKETPQIRKVYELLVKKHPNYDNFIVKDNWAYARKVSSRLKLSTDEIRKETIYKNRYIYKYVGLGSIIAKMLRHIIK